MKKETDSTGIISHLSNGDIARSERRKILQYIIMKRVEESATVQDYLLDACEKRAASETSGEDEATYREKIRDLEQSPSARPAAFLGFINSGRDNPHRRALIVFEDGTEAVPLVPNAELASHLMDGDTVIVDSRAGAIIAKDGNRPFAGETATLEKRIGEALVLVRLSNGERYQLHAASALRRRMESHTVEPGALIAANIRQRLAFCDIPSDQDALSHFRFLDRTPLPDIAVGDVGDPNPVIGDVISHVNQELTHSDKRRRYGLPRSFFGLLLGPAGTGKSHSLQAIELHTYALISQHLGMPIADLPRRSLTLNIPSIISKYLGESDRALADFSRECIELAKRPIKGLDGKDHLIPLIVKCEELDGLAKRRSDGDFDGGAMDRILTTFLQLFDPARPEFRDSIIILLCTSNRPQAIDPAALRRFGMRTYQFTRLTRRMALEAVLTKQLKRSPIAGNADAEAARRHVVAEMSAWLFAERDQDPIVDLAYVGSAEAVTKYRRDFLTPALINRAVISASANACAREVEGIGVDGLQVGELMAGIDAQVRSITEQQLTPENVRDYLDVPDGIRVATVRRRQKPVVQRHEALRASLPGTGVAP